MARERKRKRVTFDDVFEDQASTSAGILDITDVRLDDLRDDISIKSSASWQYHVLNILFPTALTLSEYLKQCCSKHGVAIQHVTTSRTESQFQNLLDNTLVVPFCPLKDAVRIARTNERGASERLPLILREIVHESLRVAPPVRWDYQAQFARKKRRSEPFKQAINLSPSLSSIPSVLSQGYSIQDGSGSSALRGEPVLTSHDSNSLMNHLLLSQEWISVLKRVGEGLFRHVIAQCFVFHALPNRCFLQLAGPKLDEVIRRRSEQSISAPLIPPIRAASDPLADVTSRLTGFKRSHSVIESVLNAGVEPSTKRILKRSNPVCVSNRYVARHNLLFQTEMYAKIGLGDQHIFNTIPSRADPSSTACSIRSIRNLVAKVFEVPRNPSDQPVQPISRSSSGLGPPSRSNSGLAAPTRSNSGLTAPTRSHSGLAPPSRSGSGLMPLQRTGSDVARSTLNSAQRSVSFEVPEIRRNKHVRLSPGLQSLVPIFTSLIHRHRNCYYHLLFERHVPVPYTSSQLDLLTMDELMLMEASVSQVQGFVRATMRNVLPLALFGSAHNRASLLKTVAAFIALRRGESMRTHSIMQGIRICDIQWLSEQSLPDVSGKSVIVPRRKQSRILAHGLHLLSQLTPDPPPSKSKPQESGRSKAAANGHLKRVQLAATLFHFLLAHFVVPLLRSAFHCTDSEFGKNRILFYPHRVWANIRKRAMASFISAVPSGGVDKQNDKQAQFRKLPRNAHESAARARNNLGLGHLRLKPRKTGIRSIVNMARASKLAGHSFAPVNRVLRPVLDAITFERSQDVGMMGASVFGLNDIYLKYRAFVQSVRSQNLANVPLYFISMDISSCFDYIDRQKLIGLSALWFDQVRYTHHPYYAVRTKLDSCAGRFQRFSLSLALSTSSFDVVVQDLATRSRSTVFVDLVKRTGSDKKRIERLLRDHVTANLVWYNGDVYRQERGIPQGSTLSALLCCAYIGHCETSLIFPQLGIVPGQQHASNMLQLFMRQMDDFLFVTSDAQLAQVFPLIVKSALGSYHLEINERKTRIMCSSVSDTLMPWSGLLINPRSLAVHRDSLRYAAAPMRDQLRMEFERRPGVALAAAVRRTVQHNANPIFFDPIINSAHTILLNLAELFVVSAIKCETQAWALKRHPATFVNEKMLFAAIEESVRLAWHLIVAGIRHHVLPNTSTTVALCLTCRSSTCAQAIRHYFPFSSHQCRWLAMKCFVLVFQRKHQRFPVVLQLMKQAMLDIQHRRPCHNKQLVTQSLCACCQNWQFVQQHWSQCVQQVTQLISSCRF